MISLRCEALTRVASESVADSCFSIEGKWTMNSWLGLTEWKTGSMAVGKL